MLTFVRPDHFKRTIFVDEMRWHFIGFIVLVRARKMHSDGLVLLNADKY